MNVSQEAYIIHRFTSCGEDAAQNFIDENNIDAKKLIKFIRSTDNEGMRKRYMVRDVINGKIVGKVKDRFIKDFKMIANKNDSKLKETIQRMQELAGISSEAQEPTNNDIKIDWRDVHNVSFQDVHHWDRPDYSDAFIDYAEHSDGSPYTEDELDALNDDADFVHDLLMDYLD